MTQPSKKDRPLFGIRILLILTPILLVLLAFVARAGVYSWTDEQGTRHFSDTPPQLSVDVHVAREIPHDKIADKKHDDVYRQMMKEIAAQQRMREETVETESLKRRLEKAERQARSAQKQAEEAMKKAEEAQSVASERQRYREVYIIPPRGIGPYPRNVITPPSGY
jgi:membrane protein involved in colicin uptake